MSRNRNSARNKNSRNSNNEYQQLEPRQLLAVDVGFGFTPSTFDPTAPFESPSVSGDIGPNHIVQIINGEYTVFNEAGAQQFQSTTQEFFRDLAGADTLLGQDNLNNPIFGQIQDARAVFDHDSDRWFLSSIVANEDGSNLVGNDILLAVSRTSNPLDGFQSVQFVGDSSGDHFNSFATLAVNGDSVVITTNNEVDPLNTSVSVYAIPKADLVGFAPSAINLERFENLDQSLYGSTIQFATDLDGDSGSTLGIGTFDSGTSVSLIELANVGDPLNPATITRTVVTVPFYEAAENGRQPGDANLSNISPDITGNVVSQGGFLWTAHAVEGSTGNSAVRWYQVDESSGVVVNTDLIEDPALDFLYPSIAVNEFGTVAIGFSGAGEIQNPSSFLSIGFSSQGLDATPTVTFPEGPAIVQAGADNLIDLDGVAAFGEFSATRVDPDNPFGFFTFQEFVAGNDIWGTSITQARITDIAPVIAADASDNDVIIRRSSTNNGWVEVVIDGVVTDTYEASSISAFQLDLFDGDDVITIDSSLGQFAPQLGFTINGGTGQDTLTVVDTTGHRFEITGDGSGTLDFNNTFTGFEELSGSNGNDLFIANNSATDWILNGGAGDDLFDIGNTVSGAYELNGMSGDDSYRVPLANFASIAVNDSLDAENDSLIGIGTTGDDDLIVDGDTLIFNGIDVSVFGFAGIENLDFDGIDGDDTFNIRAINANASFFGAGGDDTFNISSDAPNNGGVLTGIQGELNIDGGDGQNRIQVANRVGIPVVATLTADQILGFTASPINFTGSFGTRADGLAGIILTGSDLAGDLFEVQEVLPDNSALLQGGLGNDVFTVRRTTIGDVTLDGQGGEDIYRTTFGSVNRSVTVNDSGGDVLADRFSIRATEGIDDITIAGNLIGVLGEQFAWSGVENLVVDVLEGDDLVTVGNNNTAAIRVVLNDGNDTGIVIGSEGIGSLRFDGLAGDDQFAFEDSIAASFVQGRGGEGNDTFLVGESSFARSRVDGELGDDTVTVEFASRDSRRVNARDTGDGFDTLNVLGTPTADRLDLFTQIIDREGEAIVYDTGTELIDLNLFGSNDIINVAGTAAASFEANLGNGNDIININSTASPADFIEFIFELGSGNDVANVNRVSADSRVEIFGQTGNDSFNVGSTRDANNGNLNLLRGELFIGGGANTAGDDMLQINDAGAGFAPFGYSITDRLFASRDPGFSRPFTGINFNSIELVFATGASLASNTFFVTPSTEAVIRVDGNDQTGNIRDELFVNANPNNAELRQGANSDNGFFEFSNGLRNVSFQAIDRAVIDLEV